MQQKIIMTNGPTLGSEELQGKNDGHKDANIEPVGGGYMLFCILWN